jgi:SAM-dependent methyltransferase
VVEVEYCKQWPKTAQKKPDYCGWYEPLGTERLAEVFNIATREVKEPLIKFLDVGCGPGNVMQFAAGFFAAQGRAYDCLHGIEYDKKLIAQGASMMRAFDRMKIERADALLYMRYAEYNFVYCFNILHGQAQRHLEQRIAEFINVGTVFATPWCGDAIRGDGRFKRISKEYRGALGIYKKISL